MSFRRMEEDYESYGQARANQDEETMRRLEGSGWDDDDEPQPNRCGATDEDLFSAEHEGE